MVGQDPHLLCVYPDRFIEQLEQLRRDAEIVPMRDVQTPASGRRVAITFDDGYADNAHVARPILESIGAPATFYITAGNIGTDRWFWWDSLASLVLTSRGIDRLPVDIDGDLAYLDLGSEEQRLRSHSMLHKRMRQLPSATIEQILGELGSRLGVVYASEIGDRAVTGEELRSLSSDLFEIGAHSMSHPLLSARSLDEQRNEIVDSRTRLESMIGMPVTSFSYPFGGNDAFNDDTVRLVLQAGYGTACTGIAGRVSRRTDPLRLPRHFVRNLDQSDFRRWLSRCFAAR
jgi:peptidoglycan/xylan/chitin deacetylase (PgdA/CDA1 family)